MNLQTFTSFQGRIPRKTFWLALIVMIVITWILEIILFTVFGVSMMSMDPNATPEAQAAAAEQAMSGMMIPIVILILITIWPSLAIYTKRWHDRDKSGWVADRPGADHRRPVDADRTGLPPGNGRPEPLRSRSHSGISLPDHPMPGRQRQKNLGPGISFGIETGPMKNTPHDPVVMLQQQLIRCPSVTPVEAGVLSLLQGWLQPAGFTCERLVFSDTDTPDVDNLFARIGTGGPHFCFAGHTDVVCRRVTRRSGPIRPCRRDPRRRDVWPRCHRHEGIGRRLRCRRPRLRARESGLQGLDLRPHHQ